jgi:23S rRNA (adenine2030-N6)-methyltransferase
MLSYRHGFHAGNHADVLKHAVLVHCLQYSLKKPKPFLYVDTHAGAGAYSLDSDYALKNREFEMGIRKLKLSETLPALLAEYLQVLESMGCGSDSISYPGSPAIAAHLLRPNDQLRLHELHPNDHAELQARFASDKRVTVIKKDGFRGMIKAFPPPARRAVVLIDPSYELERDYTAVPLAIDDALFKFPSATILIWYPLLGAGYHEYLKNGLREQGHENWLSVELKVRPESPRGMWGSGMWVVNPPWTLPEALKESEILAKLLGETAEASLTVRAHIV